MLRFLLGGGFLLPLPHVGGALSPHQPQAGFFWAIIGCAGTVLSSACVGQCHPLGCKNSIISPSSRARGGVCVCRVCVCVCGSCLVGMVHPKLHTARYRVPWVMGLCYNKAMSSAPHTVPRPSILRRSPFPSIPQNRAPHSHCSPPPFSHSQVDARSSSQIYFCSGWLSAPPQPGHSTMSCPKTSSQPWGAGGEALAFGTASRTPGYTSQLAPPVPKARLPGLTGH